MTSTVSYTLLANVEVLNLSGSAALDGTGNELDNIIRGNTGDNVLSGLDGSDTLQGKGGNDTLDGGPGADKMYGGTGDDTYVVDNAGDLVVENSGEGTDLVMASLSYTLTANVENLTLTGSGADNLTGGAGNDTFVYTDISDSLVGSADLITDFTSTSGAGAADDKLDLSGIDASTGTDGDQAFGWAQLTPPAHSIWIGGANPDGSIILYGDVNGDTTPDFELHVVLTSGQLFTDDIVF